MYKYITAEQFNKANWQNLQDKPFEDEWSRFIIKQLFAKYSPNVKSVYDYTGNSCLDLKLTMKSKNHIGIEIKFRSDLSTKYPSHMINHDKWQSILKRMNNKWIQQAYLTTIWYNGVIWCSDIFGENDSFETHLQNKTTNVSATTDYNKVWKDGHYYKPEKVFYFCYEYDDELNQYMPYFSTEPINVAELNRLAEEQTKPDPLF